MPPILDKQGMLIDSRIGLRRFQVIEHGNLDAVHAIVIHQTDGGSAQDAFNSYKGGVTEPIFWSTRMGASFKQPA